MVKFFKRGATPSYTITPNATYGDLYDNNITTVDVQSGTISDITKTTVFLSDFNIASTPDFGSANLIGGKIGFYTNSISAGDGLTIAGFKAYKVFDKIGDREGGKSATGSLISDEDIVQISSYHTDGAIIGNDFSGESNSDKVSLRAGNSTFVGSEAFVSRSDGYHYGMRFGENGGFQTADLTSSEHFERYGTTDSVHGEIYYIEKVILDGVLNGTWGNYQSVKEYTRLLGYNREIWPYGEENGSDNFAPCIKYGTMSQNPNVSESGVFETETILSTKNSFFDRISHDLTHTDVYDGVTRVIAKNSVTVSEKMSLVGGSSIHFDALHTHRFKTTSQMHYPKRAALDGSENQQVSFVSKEILLPTHLYSRAPVATRDGKQPVMPTIEIDINIEDMSPILQRDQTTYGQPAHDYRLNRSFVITFGEERPTGLDNLYSYLIEHAPNSASAGTGSGMGLGTSAKSLFGLAICSIDGNLGVYHLGAGGLSGGVYTDVTWILDSTTAEVAFASAPSTSSNLESLSSGWLRLSIQMHPNDHGFYYTISDPQTGDIFTQNDPYDSNKVINIKNTTASGSVGLWANTLDNIPLHMTMWCNNYQGVKGMYNEGAGLYGTGLFAYGSGSLSGTNLLVYSKNSAATGYGVSSGMKDPSYLMMDGGDGITLAATGDGSSAADALISENPNSRSSGRASLTLAGSTSYTGGDEIFYQVGDEPDRGITTDLADTKVSVYVDAVRFKNFNLQHENATPSNNTMVPGRLYIPETKKLPATAWQDGTGTVTNIEDNRTQQPSYICLGFDDIADITSVSGKAYFIDDTCDTTHTGGSTTTVTHDANSWIVSGLAVSGTGIPSGAFIESITDSTHFVLSAAATATNNNEALTFKSIKYMLMNNFKTTNSTTIGNIVTSTDSDVSNIRVGYTSSVEAYGRQGAADSLFDKTAVLHPDIGAGESPVMSNLEGSPSYLFRGLVVGDLDTEVAATFETINMETTDGTTPGVVNIDGTAVTITTNRTAAQVAALIAAASYTNYTAAVTSTIRVTFTQKETGIAGNVPITMSDAVYVKTGGGNHTISKQGGGTDFAGGGNNEFSVEANGSGNDGVGNVDYFTQKGLMKFNFGYREVDSGDEASNDDDAVVAEAAVTFKVGDADNFPVNGYIKIGEEIMLVDIANSSTNVLTVRRAQLATVAVEHDDASTIYWVAVPEKRECIFASARVIDSFNNVITVDDISIFSNKVGEEYILYKYNDSHSSPTSGYPKTLTINKMDIQTRTITFNERWSWGSSNRSSFLISPKRHWLIIEILNMAGAHGWQDDTAGTTKYLPEKSYSNLVGISEKGSYGATFNEALYNDGRYNNKWDLDVYNKNSGTVDIQDYGFGDVDKELNTGGHAGIYKFNIINDVNKYNEMDVSGIFNTGDSDYKSGGVVPLLLTTLESSDNVLVNIDTDIGTNPIYFTTTYEDDLPKVDNFTVKPNEENAFNVDFTWNCNDDDLWYGFLMIDNKSIDNQYTNAVLHYPMNEAGSHGDKATAPVDKIQGMATAVDSVSSTGPFYDVEGLAGNCLRNDATNTPEIAIGTTTPAATTGVDPLASTGYAVTDEMTINFHFIHDLDADGTLSSQEYLLKSTQRFQLKINTNGTLEYRQYWDTDSFIKLTSSSPVAMDGERPTNVMITFDANLISGNVKLFVNGKLEDLTGVVITADDSGEQTGWYHKQEIEHNTNVIWVGNLSATSAGEFLGRIEELVIYNKCLYPVSPSDGKFTFTKPLKEVADSSSYTSSKPYSARLFIKDYHNIRGTTTNEVASSPPTSFRKAAFRLDNS